MKNIVLTGFMGSGKSSVGLELSKKLNLTFIDTDIEIEKDQGLLISKIFEKFGESYFRDLESNIIKKLAVKTDYIISLGGGAFCNQANIDILKSNSLTIYLKIPIEIILNRMTKEEIEKRPLFKNIENVKELLNKREYYYNQAELIIDTSDKNIVQITYDIWDYIKN